MYFLPSSAVNLKLLWKLQCVIKKKKQQFTLELGYPILIPSFCAAKHGVPKSALTSDLVTLILRHIIERRYWEQFHLQCLGFLICEVGKVRPPSFLSGSR